MFLNHFNLKIRDTSILIEESLSQGGEIIDKIKAE